MEHTSFKYVVVTYFVLGFLVATCISSFDFNFSFESTDFSVARPMYLLIPRIRYTIIFKNDSYAEMFSYKSDNYIHVVNQCSKGTHPERVHRKRIEALTVKVSWCRMIHVKVICKEFWMQRDYIPRNYEFFVTFDKNDLDNKSLMFHKNNVQIVIEKGNFIRSAGSWELTSFDLLEQEELTTDVEMLFLNGSASYLAPDIAITPADINLWFCKIYSLCFLFLFL